LPLRWQLLVLVAIGGVALLAFHLTPLARGGALLAVSLGLALCAVAGPIERLRGVAPKADEAAATLLSQQRARRRSQRNDDLLRAGVETLREGLAIFDEDDRLVICNESYKHLFPNSPERVVAGVRFEELLRDGVARGHSSEARGREEEWIAERVRDHRYLGGTFEQRLPDGRCILMSNQPLPNGGIVGLCMDITVLKTAERALRISEERFRIVVESVPDAIIMCDRAGQIEMVNTQAERMFGYSRVELLERPLEILLPAGHRQQHRALHAALFAEPQPGRMEKGRDFSGLRKNGSEFPIDIGLSLIKTDAGVMVLSSIIDTTRRTQAEEHLLRWQRRTEEMLVALRKSEEQLRHAQQLAHMGSFAVNLWTGAAEVSDETVRIFGVTRTGHELDLPKFMAMVHPDDRLTLQVGRELARRGIRPDPTEFRVVRSDGTVRWIYNENELLRDENGQPLYLAGTLHDVTERRQTEEQLRQAQKMEAIGNLTGGMAHDFNNLLGVIIGNLDYVRARIGGDAELLEVINDAHGAAWHGADLTRRLLAFARRQPLRPEPIDVNELIANTVRLLRRLIGEDIDVTLKPEEEIWRVVADPAQLEASLANLATNARDAMPKGGQLTIATANRRLDAEYVVAHADASEGDFVMIEVADSGTGMSNETMSQIFEPFFTTKEPGKGTGLGLSMVFGFTRQSGGHVSVSSALGSGTIFRLYLPRATEDAADPNATVTRVVEQGIGEFILVVEDNPAVRRAVVRQLHDLGYRTFEAESAVEAFEMLEREPIDLLFTDIVMPGRLDGMELARMALERWPAIKVLLTSGFPQSRIDGDDAALKGVRLLSKPYSRAELAALLRAILDG
jgi:PAS domain S-box-containing protein